MENQPDADVEAPSNDPSDLLRSLQKRATTLLTEFRSYQIFLRSKDHARDVESRIFRRGVEAEFKSLGNITTNSDVTQETSVGLGGGDEEHKVESKRLHMLRSSNLPFYEAIWSTAKHCRGIRALGKRVYWNDGDLLSQQSRKINEKNSHILKPRQNHRKSALVDIIADDGSKWIKVSIVSAKRLIFEMAKEGWEDYGSDTESDLSESETRDSYSPSRAGKLEIVRLAEELIEASRAIRIKYRHPQVEIIMPKLREGEDKHIDAVIRDIRAVGAIVKCGEAWQANGVSDSDHLSPPPPDFDRMLPSSSPPPLTSTLNIDCTILLALISDISHVSREELPPCSSNQSGTYHSAIIKQIESDEAAPLLPSELYSILSGKSLLCTSHAAQRMREIVCTMGTKSETLRAEILLGEGRYEGRPVEELAAAWQRLSCHVFPETIEFPLTVEDFTFTPEQRHTIFQRLTDAMNLSPINASVFLYGWIHDIVTVTSNRVVAAGIERTLNQILDDDERAMAGGEAAEVEAEAFVGPKMYVCETARSLVGKEKQNGLRP
jgi:Protein of unknown function (DUF1308)